MRFSSVSFLAVIALALGGCSSTPGPARTGSPVSNERAADNVGKAASDSGLRHTIACSGTDWADCYEKAGAACVDKGYVIRGHGNTASAGAGRTGGGAQRTMLIECKDYSPR